MTMISISGTVNYKHYYLRRILDAKLYNTIPAQKKCIEQWMNEGTCLKYYISGYNSEINFITQTPENTYTIFRNKDKKIISSTGTGKIAPGDKIYFSDSTFPSLLLGRLDTKLKRTTKADIADKIISDCKATFRNIFKSPVLLDTVNNILVKCEPEYGESQTSYVNKVKYIQQIMKHIYNYDLTLYIPIYKNDYEEYQKYLKNPNKYVSTVDFTKYVVSQLPVLQEDEINNIIYMLKSQDKSTVGTALGTLQYYNFFNYGIDILSALVTTSCLDLPDNREAEYIYSLLNTNKYTLKEARRYDVQRKIQFFMNSFNNFVVTPNMSVKDKVYTIMRSILFDEIDDKYKDELERLNVTLKLIPNDENGEADGSSSEVEGEEV